MKRTLLLSAFAIAGVLNTNAQVVPTGGFESWGSTQGQAQEPNNWVTSNILTVPIIIPQNPTSVYKTTAPGEFHGGASGMKITTVKLVNNPFHSSGVNDTTGFALVGTVQIPSFKQGFQYTGRPDKFDFWYKYTPVSGDHAGALAYLTKWMGTHRDTVATAYYIETSAVSSMTAKSVTFVYNPAYNNSGNPDTAIVGFSSSVGSITPTYLVRPKIGSALWVDDADFSGTHVGIKEYTKLTEVKAYPNPATTVAHFSVSSDEAAKVELFDITGKKVGIASFEDKKARINTEHLASGLYIYRIVDADKRVMNTGKLNVN